MNDEIKDIIDSDNANHDFMVRVKDLLPRLPTKPGIYQYKNKDGKVIYVGKAKNLRNRVRSYFQGGRIIDAKTKALLKKIADLEVLVTDSEAEALILEDTLIKKLKPRYNILLKDDKTYPYIRVTNEPFPRVFVTRTIVRDGSKYFGPYTEVRNLRQLMKTLRALFSFRSCDLNITDEAIEKKKFKVCLDYHIHKCEGPCVGLVAKELYNENVRQAIQILNGKTHDIEKRLEMQMEILAEDMKFEEAAIVRNRYLQLKEFTSNQKIVTPEIIDRDVFGLARIEDIACTLIFKIREGKLIGKRHYIVTNAKDQPDEEIIGSTVEQWYMENDFVPREIFLPAMPEQIDFVLKWLKEKRGKSVEITVPKIGEKLKLVNMAATNAEFIIREFNISKAKKDQTTPRAVLSLQRDLRLSKPPVRIECFDNSHIQGSELVSSMVVFVEGKPKKSEYRKFKNKTVNQNDDFAAMREVIQRRYSRAIEEKSELPDLIIIDGGKGQLSQAVDILRGLGLKNIPVIGLAKRLDEIFFPGKSESLLLPKTSSSLRLIQQLRDEAHRFAITYHRLLRDKRTLKTELTDIPGVGEKTAQKLLITFGSVENLKNASYDDIKKAAGSKTAEAIKEHFEGNANN